MEKDTAGAISPLSAGVRHEAQPAADNAAGMANTTNNRVPAAFDNCIGVNKFYHIDLPEIEVSMRLVFLQLKYLAVAAAIMPIAPFLYFQGKRTRRRVGVLPPAGGNTSGVARIASGEGGEYSAGEAGYNDHGGMSSHLDGRAGDETRPARLLAIGESTVAGLGARTHELALAGQFARHLGKRIGRSVEWTVIGKSGVTARRAIIELIPQIPDVDFDFVLAGLGGNDVLKLSSPLKWRRDISEFIGMIRSRHPEAEIFLTNCPMVNRSPVIPQPIRGILWELSKMHDANIREITAGMNRVHYFPQPRELRLEGFFADGIHPSEKGYAEWSEAMVNYFAEKGKW